MPEAPQRITRQHFTSSLMAFCDSYVAAKAMMPTNGGVETREQCIDSAWQRLANVGDADVEAEHHEGTGKAKKKHK
jgi:hypothetical protein